MNKRKMHVIDTARELFIKHGYHATSIQDILEASGISKGSFYNYFHQNLNYFSRFFHRCLHYYVNAEMLW